MNEEEGIKKPSVGGWMWFFIIVTIATGFFLIQPKEKEEKEKPPTYPLSGIYVIPPGKTIVKTIEGEVLKYYWRGHDCKDTIYVRIKQGDWYRNLVWDNSTLKDFKIKKRLTKIVAAPPNNENIIKFKNLDDDTNIVVKVRIFSCK